MTHRREHLGFEASLAIEHKLKVVHLDGAVGHHMICLW